MTRLNVWSSCNRVLDEKWKETQREAHRVRLESIHVMPSKLSPPRAVRGATATTFKVQPKSKSPAAKARQAEIERENRKMIKKIVELQNGGGLKAGCETPNVNGKRRLRPVSATTSSSRSLGANMAGNHGYDPNPLTGFAPGGSLGVPTAVSHVLYTRQAVTTTHHFAEQNDVARNFVPGKKTTAEVRRRTQIQIQHENRKLLQRILSSKTTFNRASWQSEERERRKLLESISRFSHLSKRHSMLCEAPQESMTPSKSRARLAIDRASSADTARVAHSQSHHILQTFQADTDGIRSGGRRRLSVLDVIRTGSPVTHLRPRVRPQSACALTRASRSVSTTFFKMANGEYVEVGSSCSAAREERAGDDHDDHDDADEDGIESDEDAERGGVAHAMTKLSVDDTDAVVETNGDQQQEQ